MSERRARHETRGVAAGLRVGAGLVTVLSPPDAVNIYSAALEAVMVRVFENEAALTRAVRMRVPMPSALKM